MTVQKSKYFSIKNQSINIDKVFSKEDKENNRIFHSFDKEMSPLRGLHGSLVGNKETTRDQSRLLKLFKNTSACISFLKKPFKF
jgi:hypothetical protein